jgi:predicted DNA-binding transcriptional regulator AlpA
MPREIDGIQYVTMVEVLERLGISRQTLWRWRDEDAVPAGRRFRGRTILFTESEFEVIRDYANRMEPVKPRSGAKQLRLFQNGTSSSGAQ